MRVRSLGQENPREEGMVTHSSILAWRILWTEEPGGLQSMRSHRVRRDWSDLACTYRQEWSRGGGQGEMCYLLGGKNEVRMGWWLSCWNQVCWSGFFSRSKNRMTTPNAPGKVWEVRGLWTPESLPRGDVGKVPFLGTSPFKPAPWTIPLGFMW